MESAEVLVKKHRHKSSEISSPGFESHLNLIVVDFVAQPVAVGGEGDDVAVGKVRDDEAFARQRQVERVGQAGRGVERSQQVAEGRVDENGAVCWYMGSL